MGMEHYLNVFKKYAVFTGRSTRAEYWYFVLGNIVVMLVLGVLANVIGKTANYVSSLYSLAAIIPSISVGIRRLHDTNKSGWMLLLSLIPVVGAIILIVFLATDGQADENQYGPDPKIMESAQKTAPVTTMTAPPAEPPAAVTPPEQVPPAQTPPTAPPAA